MPSPPKLETVSIEASSGVALIKYNRPKAGNAINQQAFQEMATAMAWATQDPDVRVIVQSGEGKFFTAGMDLMDGVYDDPTTVLPDASIQSLDKFHTTLINSDKVFIAAVNGPGIGYGTSSIALFDLVYAVPDAFFFTPFVKWGLCAEACSSYTFSRVLGRQKASALILGDERMSAAELERAGLITKILPRSGFLDEVMKIATRIAQLPAQSLVENKRLMMRWCREDLLQTNAAELHELRVRARHAEAKTAIGAFAAGQERKKNSSPSKL